MKGIRTLPTELADQLLRLSGCGLENLISAAMTETNPGGRRETQRKIPDRESPAAKLPSFNGNLPSHQLADDPLMEPRLRGGDLVFYEPQAGVTLEINARSLYLIRNEGKTQARYLRLGGKRLYLVSDASLNEPVHWDYVSLADRHILEIVRGRIVWICRKVEEAEPGATEEARGLDRRVS